MVTKVVTLKGFRLNEDFVSADNQEWMSKVQVQQNAEQRDEWWTGQSLVMEHMCTRDKEIYYKVTIYCFM